VNVSTEELIQTQEEISEILSDFSQFYVLLLLSEGELHGYGLIKAFKNRTGNNLSAGTLYPFVHKLDQKGLVIQRDTPVGKKPKTIYSLTEKGREFVNGLFRRFASITATAIEPSLKTCASCGVRVYEGGYFEEVKGQKMAFCCHNCASAFKAQG
jgi:DNA-binding PadR family transcriptional regulator